MSTFSSSFGSPQQQQQQHLSSSSSQQQQQMNSSAFDSPRVRVLSSSNSNNNNNNNPPATPELLPNPPICDECDQIATVECVQCCLPFCAQHDLERHCGKRSSQHVRAPVTQAAGGSYACRYCPVHPGENLRLYCTETKELICDLCAVVGKYKGKNCVLLEDACVLLRDSLQGARDMLQDALLEHERFLLAVQQRTSSLTDSKQVLQSKINTVVEDLKILLETRRNAMLQDIDNIHEEKHEGLSSLAVTGQSNVSSIRGALEAADKAMTTPFRRGHEFAFVSEAVRATQMAYHLPIAQKSIGIEADLGVEIDGVYSEALSDMLSRLTLRNKDSKVGRSTTATDMSAIGDGGATTTTTSLNVPSSFASLLYSPSTEAYAVRNAIRSNYSTTTSHVSFNTATQPTNSHFAVDSSAL